MFAIKIEKTGRYIDWFNECWYTTTKEPVFLFDEEDAKKSIDTLSKHYINTIIVVGKDGNEERVSVLQENVVFFGKNGLPHVINKVNENTNEGSDLDDFEF